MKALVHKYGLPLFFFLLPWQTRWIFGDVPLDSGVTEFGVLSLYATEVFLLFVVLFSGRPRYGTYSTLPRLFVCLLGVFFLIATLFSVEISVSLTQLMHVGFAAMLFFALLDERVDLKMVAFGFLAGLIAPIVLGGYQFFLGESGASTLLGLAVRDAERSGDAILQASDGVRTLRAYGSFPHPNIFGGYLAVAVVTCGWLVKEGYRRFSIAAVFIFLLFGLVLTFSRAAWLGLLLALIVGSLTYFMNNTRLARILIMPISALFIAGIFIVSFGLGVHFRPGSDAAFEVCSVDERSQQYADFPSVLHDDWFIGHGLGTYVYALEDTMPGREWWQYQPIHNVVLLSLAEVGVVGMMLIAIWVGLIDFLNFSRFPQTQAIAAFMMGNVILVILFFDHYLWSSWAGLVLLIYVMAMTVRLGASE